MIRFANFDRRAERLRRRAKDPERPETTCAFSIVATHMVTGWIIEAHYTGRLIDERLGGGRTLRAAIRDAEHCPSLRDEPLDV